MFVMLSLGALFTAANPPSTDVDPLGDEVPRPRTTQDHTPHKMGGDPIGDEVPRPRSTQVHTPHKMGGTLRDRCKYRLQ